MACGSKQNRQFSPGAGARTEEYIRPLEPRSAQILGEALTFGMSNCRVRMQRRVTGLIGHVSERPHLIWIRPFLLTMPSPAPRFMPKQAPTVSSCGV